jgi:hypothetical protein
VVALLLGAGFAALITFVLFLWYDVRDELRDNQHRKQIRTLKEQIYSASDYDNVLLAGREWLDELTQLSPLGKRCPVVATCFNSFCHPEVLARCEELRGQIPALRSAHFHTQSDHPESLIHSDKLAADPNALKRAWPMIWLEAVQRADYVLVFDMICGDGEGCSVCSRRASGSVDDASEGAMMMPDECCSLRSSDECVLQLALLSCVGCKIVVVRSVDTTKDVAHRIERVLDGKGDALDHAALEVSQLLPELLSEGNTNDAVPAVAFGAKFGSQQVRAALATYGAFLKKRQVVSSFEPETGLEYVQHSDSINGLDEPLLPVI